MQNYNYNYNQSNYNQGNYNKPPKSKHKSGLMTKIIFMLIFIIPSLLFIPSALRMMNAFGQHQAIKDGSYLLVQKETSYNVYYEDYITDPPNDVSASFEFENTKTGEKYQTKEAGSIEKFFMNDSGRKLVAKIKLPKGTYRISSNSSKSKFRIYETMSLSFSGRSSEGLTIAERVQGVHH